MSIKSKPGTQENWIKSENKSEWKRSATNTLVQCKKYEDEHEFIYVPHPKIRNTFIRKLIQ